MDERSKILSELTIGNTGKVKGFFINLKFPHYTVLVFAFVYAIISLVNHYQFRTYAWDLGINNNAIWDYSHFRWNNCMIIDGPQFENILSDHLSFYPIIVSPLIWIFGSYTMLIFQILSILFGGIGVRKLVLMESSDFKLANISLVMFYSMWGIFSALSFDYHDNVVAAMMVPWLFYYFLRDDYLKTIFFTLIVLISKENMALWVVFIGIGLFLRHFKHEKKMFLSLTMAILAILYFYLAIKVIMPYFSNAGRGYLHFNYSALGNDFGEAIINIFRNPLHILKLLWINPTGLVDADGIKLELHMVFFLSGGILLFRRPSYLVMLLPIYAQKLFNDDFAKWGINYHYSIEFAPMIVLGVFDVLCGMKVSANFRNKLAWAIAICSIVVNFSKIDSRVSKWYTKENLKFYHKMHYTQTFDVSEVHDILRQIPADASVKASSILVPHLAFREVIYQYPSGPETDYIVLLDNSNTFPLTKSALREDINRLLKSDSWETVHAGKSCYVFKKMNPVDDPGLLEKKLKPQ